MSAQSQPVLLLMGPTASSKTDAAVHLAERAPVDIVSVDSAMVYRGMDIGTGKPSPDVLARAPHQLVDVRDPWEGYSAGDFVRDARAAIAASHAAGRVPLLVGGTNLYFNTLRGGLSALPPASPAFRQALDAQAEQIGWPALHARLARSDPKAAGRIDANDRQRIQRALEVLELTGQPISTQQVGAPAERYDFSVAVLMPSTRARLHARIEQRLDAMLAAGFLDEVASLLSLDGIDENSQSLRAVGYRQLARAVSGVCDLRRARDQALFATRQLAKRQLTWLRRETPACRLDSDSTSLWTESIQWFEGSMPSR